MKKQMNPQNEGRRPAMDSRKYILLIDGQDKTDSVVSFRFRMMCARWSIPTPQSPTATVPKKYSF